MPEITGDVLVFLCDNIYLVVGGVALYAWGRKRQFSLILVTVWNGT